MPHRYSTNALLLGSCLVIATVACDRNIEPFDPSEQPRQPDLARIFPAPEEGELAAGARAGAAPFDTTARAPDAAVGRPSAAVRGTVHLADAAVGRGGVLFIIVRPKGAVGGPPLAVVRIAEPEFPQDFEIGPANVMIPSMKFEGALMLTARLDADGNALTRDAGDPSASSPDAIVPGTLGVELMLR